MLRKSAQRLDYPIQAAIDAIIYSKLIESHHEKTRDAASTELNAITDEMTLIQLCSCLYLAAKVNEFELVKIRDIINVVQFTLKTEK